MTQNTRPRRQLELPMLADVNTKALTGAPSRPAVTQTDAAIAALAASELDMRVYKRIATNYFHSLKKV